MVKNYHRYSYVMRTSAIIIGIQIFFSSFLIAGTINAQTIKLNFSNTNVQQVFASIETQTHVTFVYTAKTLEGLDKISIKADAQPLHDVLKTISDKLPLKFQQSGNVIGVGRVETNKKSKVEAEAEPETPVPTSPNISGTVTDSTGNAIYGATVRLVGTSIATTTDVDGRFSLNSQTNTGNLSISFIGYKTEVIALSDKTAFPLEVVLHTSSSQLQQVAVVSNGYQTLPKERVTGSFDQINNQLINRSTGTNIIDRLNGISNGVLFNTQPGFTYSGIFTGTSTNIRQTGITIRGTSTLSPSTVGTDPLIVLDNFPFNGDLRDINPNDVESITILKDAAAASIWGARAGNGVIVITTKKGSKNQAPKVDFNSNVTIGNKPNIFKSPYYVNSKDYINAETYLFNQDYFNSDLTNTSTYPVISPVVQILSQEKAGTLSQTDATTQLNALANNDVRNDYEKYIYQKSLNQQYSLGIRGGSSQLAYSASVGYDDNRDNLVRNGEQRLTVSSLNTYTPVKNLDITAGINYSQTNVQMNNQFGWEAISTGGKYGLLPYAMFASPGGTPLAIPHGYSAQYINNLQQLGYQSLQYVPLNELSEANNTSRINELILKVTATYHFTPEFNAQVLYQNERQTVNAKNDQAQQSYYVSNLIDEFAQYNSTTKTFTYPFPLGDILSLNNTDLNANNLRGQLNFNKTFKKNIITVLTGAEMNQSVTTGITPMYYGYNSEFGTSVSNLNYNTTYPTNPSGGATIGNNSGGESITTYRYLSYFANAGYTYDNRYTVTLSGRKDGANIFGVHTNDRITPLWSAGLGWNVSNERFYNAPFLPTLKLRLSYGFNGNVYNGSGYTIGNYATSSLTSLSDIVGLTAPNPNLQWEKVKNINFGIDFAFAKNILSGTIELYEKNGQDLIEDKPLAASTGFSSFNGNAASTGTKGIDITLTSQNINGQFRWFTTWLFSYLHNRVTNYDVTSTSATIQTTTGSPVVGYPIYSIFSYKWAGIDQANGNPQGYLNGKVSEDYASIINNYKPDSLKYNGSGVPTIFGSLRNDFSWRGFGLSFNIKYEMGWYFRKPSVSLNYQNILTSPNSDYALAWTHPGQQTNVPSLIYPSNSNRNTFYQYSSVLVLNGDNVRLQDVRLSYDITKKTWRGMPFSQLQVYSYASNLGVLWRANKYGIDPDYFTLLPAPFTISFGLKATY